MRSYILCFRNAILRIMGIKIDTQRSYSIDYIFISDLYANACT